MMRLILDNVSEKDSKWLLSMAKALNLKVAVEEDNPMSLDEVDKALDKAINEDLKTDSHNFGIEKAHIKEFQQRKKDYLAGKSQTTSRDTIKKQYGIL